MDSYSIEKTIFSQVELDDIRTKEQILIERGDKGYYRNKKVHGNAYKQICDAVKPYLTSKNLKMVFHPHTTQSKKSLNKSVSSYAPKHKHYSTTKSLEARVGVAAAIQICGYRSLWSDLYGDFNLNFDAGLSTSLGKLDAEKIRKRERAATIEGKKRRDTKKYKKLNDAQKADAKDQERGLAYSCGIAMKAATKKAKSQLTNQSRNPPGTAPEQYKCPFYHENYCTSLGHRTSNSKACFMYRKSKEERCKAE